MKRNIVLLVALISMLTAWGAKRKVLFVIIDGIPADCIERLQPPTMMQIAKSGNYCHSFAGGEVGTYSQTPTISAIGYTNILTGTWMNKHQVKGNDNIHPNYNYPTIFRIAKNQPQKVTTALYSSWSDNRTILLGEHLEATNHLDIDYKFDGYDHDNERFPKQKGDVHLQAVDNQVCQDAANCITEHAPDLNWLYMWYPDDAFHYNGNGKIADNAVMTADKQLAQVWQSIKEREKKHGEEWLVIVTTDHGREMRGFRHGNQSLRERTTWIATNRKKVNSHFTDGLLSQVDILPTICRFMDWNIDDDTQKELDGQPFIGKLDIENLTLLTHDKKLIMQWKVLTKKGVAKIYFTPTNNRFIGSSDQWVLLGETPIKSGSFTVDLSAWPDSKIYKVAVITPNSCLGKWYKK